MSKEIQCKCCKEYWWERNIHSKSGLCPNCYDYVSDLEAKLAESEKERELDNSFWKQECDSLQKTLVEKDKEIEKLNACVDFYKSYSVSFQEKVIDELERVKENIHYLLSFDYNLLSKVNEQFDNQIKQLKERCKND